MAARCPPASGPTAAPTADMRAALAVLTLLLASGCTNLLPRGTTDTPTGFASFEQARDALLRVQAMKTRTDELKALDFDPNGANVTLIPYPDIIGRLAPHPGVPVAALDAGVRECIAAQSACRGYLYRFDHQQRRREGSFWLDFLNIRRTTYYSGWWFEALVVVSDGHVLFRNHAGQARTDRVDRQVNPLGPFQPAGEGAGSLLLR